MGIDIFLMTSELLVPSISDSGLIFLSNFFTTPSMPSEAFVAVAEILSYVYKVNETYERDKKGKN